jgi:aminoglycoside phosphotransferase (APT) family kinase protein
MPDEPLLVGRVGGETVVVQRCNPVTANCEPATDRRALDWLVAFQRATATTSRPWSDDDSQEVLTTVERALAGPGTEAARDLLPALRSRLHRLHGVDLPRCAVHGDFWRGNLAFEGDRLRVYDWEWSRPEGLPFFDHATWEWGVLRPTERKVFPGAVRAAVDRVAQRLPHAGIPADVAPVALVYAAAELSTRVEREFGRAGAIGGAATQILAALGTLLREQDDHKENVTAG